MLNMKEKAFMKRMKELSAELKEAKKAKAEGGGLSELKEELWRNISFRIRPMRRLRKRLNLLSRPMT